ncbi:MAG: HAD family phosphatase [Candidatus Aenigmatarchaeota archaeon]
MKKTIIFDLGGVLVEDGVYPMQRNLSEKFNLDYGEVKRFSVAGFRRMFVGKLSENEFWKKFDYKFGLNNGTAELSKELHEYYKINNGVKNLIARLKKNGYKVGFLSNSTKEITGYLEKKYGFTDMFDFGVFSHKVRTRKPHKKIFGIALKRANSDAKSTIFIDDNLSYIKGAKAAGLTTIHFISAPQTIDSLKKLGVDV